MTFRNKIKLFDYAFDEGMTVVSYKDHDILFKKSDGRQFRMLREDGDYNLTEVAVQLNEIAKSPSRMVAESESIESDLPPPSRIKRFKIDDDGPEEAWKNN